MARVLFAADSLEPPLGGAERAAAELLAHLRARGHAVTTVTHDTGAAARFPARWTWSDRRARAEALAARVAESDADVVLTQLTAAPAVVAAARAPAVLFVHGYEALCHWRFLPGSGCVPQSRCRACPKTLALAPAERADRLWFADAHRASLDAAAALVVPSAHVAAEVERACGRVPHVVAPVGAPPARVAADRSGPVLAVSSVWTQAKGAGLLGPIAERLPERRFVVQVGDGSPLGALPANVEVRTAPAEIAELLPGCAAVVVPSQLPEPFGRVAFEAMAAGVPVLASDTGGLRDLVPARVECFADPDAWARALDALLAPQAWEEAIRAGAASAAAVLATDPLASAASIVEGLISPRARSSSAPIPARKSSVEKRVADPA